MTAALERDLSTFLHCDVRCQLVLHDRQVINMFDTVIDHITVLDDGGFFIVYDGGVIQIAHGELVHDPTALIIKGDDWSLFVTRWIGDAERFPTASQRRPPTTEP
ncbi:hypothetical protein [Alicyclobacillus macrosporangiidus]|uniref:hypothetical protein n=1 Tax=Alicyclobacillus macrosporangiidus TaxID=392015 RepID=UPI000497D50C|nr:hypothetical protein [Alicyclobacillus macrosporangiidus]